MTIHLKIYKIRIRKIHCNQRYLILSNKLKSSDHYLYQLFDINSDVDVDK